MPDISLFQPTVLLGVIEKFTAPETLTMLNRIDKTPHPFPTAQWDVVRGSRAIAKPNVPNSEAHIVPRLGRETRSAAFIYLREKKVFEPTTLHWLRTPGEIARVNAERAVTREFADLNSRFDNFVEYAIWQMLTGTLSLDYGDVNTTVDYKLPASHKPTASTSWATATPEQIVADVRAWKALVSRDGRVAAEEAYVTETTMAYVFDAFARAGNYAGGLLSDRMRDEYYRTGVLSNFMGLDWRIQDAVFDATGASYTANPSTPATETKFLADDTVILGNFTANRPMELIVGPTADDEAPEGFTGKFAKTWKDKDPSARQMLLEWNVLPVLTHPEQIVTASV